MNEKWIVYRDVTGEPRKTFNHINAPKPGEMVIKDQVLPGMLGFPTMYIKKHHVYVSPVDVYLITYTEKELSEEEAAALAVEGLKHVHDH